MVDVDAILFATKAEQSIALRGQVLLVGRASRVADKQCTHGTPPQGLARPSPGWLASSVEEPSTLSPSASRKRFCKAQ